MTFTVEIVRAFAKLGTATIHEAQSRVDLLELRKRLDESGLL